MGERCHWLVVLALVAGCSKDLPDADYDGVPDAEDCAPDDPSIYPGAPDVDADGIDADCDGQDGAPPYVGTWEVIDLGAMYSTFQALVPGSALGEMVIDEEGIAVLDAESQLDPELAGFALTILLGFEGHASTTPEPGGVALYLDGELDAVVLQESTYADFGCRVVDDTMACEGTMKALDTTLLTSAVFERK